MKNYNFKIPPKRSKIQNASNLFEDNLKVFATKCGPKIEHLIPNIIIHDVCFHQHKFTMKILPSTFLLSLNCGILK